MTDKHPFCGVFFQDNVGKPAPERLNQSGFKWSKRWWGGSGISWTICKSFAPRSRQITMPALHHSTFYRPGALSDAQTTASKHWRQWHTRISCRWQTRATRCITANVLQTHKVDAQSINLRPNYKLTTPRVESRQLAAIARAFSVPHLHLQPPLEVIPFEFYRDFRLQKTSVPGLSCAVVCVILRLAVSLEHRLVTDGRMDGRRDMQTHTYEDS